MSLSKALQERWYSITTDFQDDEVNKWWIKIEREYSDSSRNYHNLKHISEMFVHFDRCSENLQSPKAVAFAIFFHDLVYNPKAADNEEKSLEWFRQFAEEMGIPLDSPLYEQVSDLILLTKTHMTEEHKEEGAVGTADKHYFLDFDMAILGSKQSEYEIYAAQIRDEYAFLPNMTYNGLRAKVLSSFLQIPNIFATEEFQKTYEASARQNIQQEIRNLEA